MVRATARVPMIHRILTCDGRETELSGDPAMTLSDTVFGFLEQESEGSPESMDYGDHEDESEEGQKENLANLEDNKSFWENQRELLQATLCRTSSSESRVRDAAKEALREVEMAGSVCASRRPVSGGCRDCLMAELCLHLQNAGFDSAICKSKWKSSIDIPSGEHTFLDVVDSSNSKKGEVRVIIELNFRGEFEMARASEEYNRLVSKLPEVFIGKVERLLILVKILCSAAKKCMKEKKMHIGPWRKHRYMQAKWLRITQRTAASRPLATAYSSRRPASASSRASMLTVDLLDNLRCTAVEVL
ncbi:hypothetical protein RJ639_016701 [Escallonia herrerae]|uniref:Uncharacterized protein n=1 Tax=Escallonia herrerae TaxID=1293975 RepID=A0AA88VF90_9ASTE|nr:hypothetical protein RJ639_016701 [Escallonia herrerae]